MGTPEGAGTPRSTTTSIAASTGAAFYQPPDPLPEAEPGTLIRQEPMSTIPGARAWKVLYHSRTIHGADIAVSGMVVVPEGPAPTEGRLVVAVAPGASGLADDCASSIHNRGLSTVLLTAFLDAGYVVAITDYEGLGTPGLHPLGVGGSEGRSLLDVARAAIALPESDATDEVVLYGHSQGGHASFFGADIAEDYAPELAVLGTVSQAPVVSLVDVMRVGANFPEHAGWLVMFMRGLNAAHPDQARLDAVLTPEGIESSSLVEKECHSVVLQRLRHVGYDKLLVRNPVDVPEWLGLLEANSLGGGRISTPLLLTKGTLDELLPKASTDTLATKLCAARDVVEYRTYEGATHVSLIEKSAADVTAWIAARAAGSPVTSTC